MTVEPPSGAFGDLTRVVRRLEGAGYRCMLVGGLGVFAWGEPRMTRDFDVAVMTNEDPSMVGSKLREVLASSGAEPQGPFSTEFGMRFVLPFPSVPVDVFLAPPGQAGAFERRRRVEVQGVAFWVQGPEDLVVSKLRNAARYPDAERADLRDAATVLFKQWATFGFSLAAREADAAGVRAELDALTDEVRAARVREGLRV